ncbi:zinc finger protein 85 [Leptopilina heterotoma]|uniref:zinc finger protein 85 n=1 Tax=Leptopilina heterotoma TaxID=63436 RepID=UPI001CA8857E|nr:zinc finger protein 85 [Leptopilina heterotoma]
MNEFWSYNSSSEYPMSSNLSDDSSLMHGTHMDSRKRSFVCDNCGKSYAVQRSLWRHRKFECINAKPKFNCDLCNKKTDKKSNTKPLKVKRRRIPPLNREIHLEFSPSKKVTLHHTVSEIPGQIVLGRSQALRVHRIIDLPEALVSYKKHAVKTVDDCNEEIHDEITFEEVTIKMEHEGDETSHKWKQSLIRHYENYPNCKRVAMNLGLIEKKQPYSKPPPKYQCLFCQKKTSKRVNLLKHMHKSHGPRALISLLRSSQHKRNVRKKVSTLKNIMDLPSSRNSNRENRNIDSDSNSSNNNFEGNERSSSREVVFPDSFEVLPQPWDRKRIFAGRSEDERLFRCKFCGKGYRWKSTMRRHEMVECGGKAPSFQCPECPYKARQRGNLTVHYKRHHQKGELDDIPVEN